MPMKIIKELAVVVGSYQKDGQTKKKYKNVGSLMQMDDGSQMILLDRSFNPAGIPHKEGSENIILSMFDPKQKDGAAPVPAKKQEQEDDIPF